MLCKQITRFTKSETMGIVTELRSTCVKLGCRVKTKTANENKENVKLKILQSLYTYFRTPLYKDFPCLWKNSLSPCSLIDRKALPVIFLLKYFSNKIDHCFNKNLFYIYYCFKFIDNS